MSKPPPSRKKISRPRQVSTSSHARTSAGHGSPSAPVVSARWLIVAISSLLAIAAVSAWFTLCLLFWQGSWQLLYRPASAVTRTPANVGLPFDAIHFSDTPAGVPQLQGWWIPASGQARFAVLYLHGANGNLGDAVDDLARMHAANLEVFAIDYRGYGQSRFRHPSETGMREDAESAIVYLTDTRHLAAPSIVIAGKDLGANLALETAAAHPELAGVMLVNLLEDPVSAIFRDPRAHLVPAHMLVRDRWDALAPSADLLIPSLWLYWTPAHVSTAHEDLPPAYQTVKSRKSIVWLTNAHDAGSDFHLALARWLDDLKR